MSEGVSEGVQSVREGHLMCHGTEGESETSPYKAQVTMKQHVGGYCGPRRQVGEH